MELCSALCGSLDESRVWGRVDTWICVTESLCCSPETITTLLIGHTPNTKQKGFYEKWKIKVTLRHLEIKESWENCTVSNAEGIIWDDEKWYKMEIWIYMTGWNVLGIANTQVNRKDYFSVLKYFKRQWVFKQNIILLYSLQLRHKNSRWK